MITRRLRRARRGRITLASVGAKRAVVVFGAAAERPRAFAPGLLPVPGLAGPRFACPGPAGLKPAGLWPLVLGLLVPGFLALGLLVAGMCRSSPAAEHASGAPGAVPRFDWPPDVLSGFDPEALPLDIEVLRSWTEEGIAYEKLRFTGEVAGGAPTRVLAARGMPEGKDRVPGILHIHGGGQTLSIDWVRFWARRGYGCLTYDFCGAAYDRTEYTLWGALDNCNMMKSGDGQMSQPDPRDSSWYHWIVAARRALTVLARSPGIDADRLGIFGISVGGTLCWPVAGSDRRVKAAVPFYGCGYNVDDRRNPAEAAPPTEAQWAFKRVLSPEAWAPWVECPILFLSATNDMHGRMPTAYEILGAVRGEARAAFTPRYDHHVEPEQALDLPLWMDRHLRAAGPEWPASPTLAVSLGADGVPAAIVSAERPESVRGVEVFYSLGEKVPGARFWRRAAVAGDRFGSWRASLPVADVWRSVSVFANVSWESGPCLSSSLVRRIPAQMGRCRATLEWTPGIDDESGGIDTWYFVPAYVDPNVSWKFLRAGADDDGRRHVALDPEGFGAEVNFHIGTHAIGDPDHEGRPGMDLAFEVGGVLAAELSVRLIYDDRLMTTRTFEARVLASSPGGAWRPLRLPLSAFRAEDGRSPEAWKGAQKLELKGVGSRNDPPRFRAFRWVRTEDAPRSGRPGKPSPDGRQGHASRSSPSPFATPFPDPKLEGAALESLQVAALSRPRERPRSNPCLPPRSTRIAAPSAGEAGSAPDGLTSALIYPRR